MPIRVTLDRMLLERRMSLTELCDRVGITMANLSILKTGKAKAVRFSTLEALCRELDCQPGDLLSFDDDEDEDGRDAAGYVAPVQALRQTYARGGTPSPGRGRATGDGPGARAGPRSHTAAGGRPFPRPDGRGGGAPLSSSACPHGDLR